MEILSDGVCCIKSITNIADPGHKPVLSEKLKIRFGYERRTLGVERYEAGLRAGIRIEKVVRVPYSPVVTPQDMAVLKDFYSGEETRYMIARIIAEEEKDLLRTVGPPRTMLLELERIKGDAAVKDQGVENV